MSGDGLIERLRATRATLVANSPQDRAVRDAIMELERLRDVQPYPVPAPDDGSIRVAGRRYQRFNGAWMVQPPMLRGYVPADPVACDWLDEIERLRQGIWDACIALGMDTDGNDTPRHVVYPPLAELIVREAQRARRDYDELLDELSEARRG